MASLALDATAPSGGASAPAAGTRIGRYVVLHAVGQGASGLVVAAWDDELGRKVAIKLLPPRDAAAGDRLTREGRALARLAHANVLRIHDVGEHEQRVFMVMEYVEGAPLPARPGGTIAQRLAPWLAAGRGLAAAHAAGLVHGDIKPANVLIDREGRVRVADFGHARAAGSEPDPVRAPDLLARAATTSISTSRSDALVGTPAYMAPEVFAGATADARADQFSLCVALYEALWGVRPFAGDDVLTLADAVTHGRLRTPPALPVVPLRIRRAVLRGLATDPAARHGSMDALLAALEWDPWRWPRRLAPVAALALLSWATAHALAGDAAPRDWCAEVDERVDAMWNDDRERAIAAAFDGSAAAYGADALTAVRPALQQYAEALRTALGDRCRMQAQGDQDDAALAANMVCLHRREQQFATLLDLFERADATVVEHALEATTALAPVGSCADGHAAPRIDPALLPELSALAARIGRAEVAAAAWHDDVALDDARQAAADAVALAQPWYGAEAEWLTAKLLDRAGDASAAEQRFHAAFSAALAVDRHDIAALAAVGVASVEAQRGGHDDALRWLDHAESARSRAHDEAGRLEHAVTAARAEIAYHHGDFEAARTAFAATLALEQSRPDDGERGATLLNLGLCETNLGHPEIGMAWLERALAAEIADHGEHHPALLRPLNAICHVHTDLGHTALAVSACRRAIDLVRAQRPGAQPRLSHLYSNLGEAWFHGGEPEPAEHAYLAALDNALRTQPDDHLLLATIHNNLGVLYGHLERIDDAVAHYREAHARVLRAFGPDHPSTAMVATNLAMMLVKQARYDEAEALLHGALAAMAARLGDDHPDLALSHAELGRLHAAKGDHVAAVAAFERAWTIRTAAGGDEIELADTAWGLAHALAELHRDRARIDALVEQADALYRKAGGDWNDKAEALQQWHRGLAPVWRPA
ncbi:MAG: serine/threonine-protein kinase [Nannocystaceae bacterium]